MTYEDIFVSSYEKVINRTIGGQTFFDVFYEIFFSQSDEIATLFSHTDMERQKKVLRKSFYSLYTFYASQHPDEYLQKIALSHSREHMNIKPYLYDIWLESVIKTVRQFDDEFNNDVELSWRLVLSVGIVYMKYHYDKSTEIL